MNKFDEINIRWVLFVIFIIMPSSSWAMETTNNIDYYPGNILVIISVPHGGGDSYVDANGQSYSSSNKPCCNSLYLYDPYYYNGDWYLQGDPRTIDVVNQIQAAFATYYNYTNSNNQYVTAKPYVIVNHWARQYLDANRDPGRVNGNREYQLYLADKNNNTYTPDQDTIIDPYDCIAPYWTGSANVWAATVAKSAWFTWNGYIDAAKAAILAQYPLAQYPNLTMLYIDLHSQTHEYYTGDRQFELGYYIPAANLQEGATLPTRSATSLRYLINASDYTLEELVRGTVSFGTMMQSQASDLGLTYQCVPSNTNLNPLPGYLDDIGCVAAYDAGGWNIVYHTVVDYRYTPYANKYGNFTTDVTGHGKVSGLQIEVPSYMICNPTNPYTDTIDYQTARQNLGVVLAKTIDQYLSTHYGYNLSSHTFPYVE